MLDRASALPPLAAIRAFEAAARLGSFSRAAEELGMTPAAVSYQIRQLERRLGFAIFVRQPRSVTLTTRGAALSPVVSDAFGMLRSAFTHAVQRSEVELSITTLPTVGSSWLAPRLGTFQARHPDIAVRMDLSVPTVDFSAADFDVAIRSGLGEWPGLRSHRLAPNLFTPLCSPALLEGARALDDPGRPFPFPLLGRPGWWSRWFGALGHPGLDLTGRFGPDFGTEHASVASAIAGHGVAIASPIFFRSALESGALVPAHDLVVADQRAYWLTYPAVLVNSPKVQAFRTWIVEAAADDLAFARSFIDRCVTLPAAG